MGTNSPVELSTGGLGYRRLAWVASVKRDGCTVRGHTRTQGV